MQQTLASAPSILLTVLSGKGGVGKTLLALAIADLFELNECPLNIVQIDDQTRLSDSLKQSVHTVDIAYLKRARKDPNALLTAFSKTYDFITGIPGGDASLLIDIGATQQHAFFDYSSLIELNDDLKEKSISGFGFVPVVAEPESIRQSVNQIARLRAVLPILQPVLVLNERDGSFAGLNRFSEAGRLFLDELEPLMGSVKTLTMPRIEAGSWQLFERHNMRPIDVIAADTSRLIELTGLSRPEAKVARGDVASWFDTVEQELRGVIPFFRST